MTSISYDIVVSTPTSKPVITSEVYANCPIQIKGKNYSVNLICLSLSQLDIVLGMDWLSSSHVLLNCHDKTLVFDTKSSKFEESSRFEMIDETNQRD